MFGNMYSTYANKPFSITNINKKKTKHFSNWYAITIYFEDIENTNGYYVQEINCRRDVQRILLITGKT